MTRAWVLALLLLSASLAGCLGGSEDAPEPTAPASTNGTAGTEPGTGSGNGTEADQAASTGPVSSPSLTAGTWWRYRVEHALTEEPVEVTLAVAEATGSSYEIGWTDPQPGLATLIYHFPPVGTIQRPDLGAWYHDETVALLDFPLEDGKTWTTQLGDSELTMQAERNGTFQGGPHFTIRGTDANGALALNVEYSAAVGFYTSIERFFEGRGEPSPGIYLEETGDAASIDGEIVVPEMEDLVNTANLGPDPEAQRPPAGEVHGSFTVDDDHDYLVLGAFMGGGPGFYQTTWRPQQAGPITSFTTNEPGSSSVALSQVQISGPEGSWTYDLTAGGPGFVFAEAIGVATTNATVAAAG